MQKSSSHIQHFPEDRDLVQVLWFVDQGMVERVIGMESYWWSQLGRNEFDWCIVFTQGKGSLEKFPSEEYYENKERHSKSRGWVARKLETLKQRGLLEQGNSFY